MQNTLSLKELFVLALVVFNDEKNADVNTVFAAEDGNVFVDLNRAKLHTQGKTEMKYFTITRAEAEASNTDDVSGQEIDEVVVSEKTKELQDLELVVANYQKMKSLVLFFQIETPDLKAESLITALTEYKSKISA